MDFRKEKIKEYFKNWIIENATILKGTTPQHTEIPSSSFILLDNIRIPK
tara:strand:- start:270 stop:416 length:147 start_codon:yes stop_codon:yes gene_type:complete